MNPGMSALPDVNILKVLFHYVTATVDQSRKGYHWRDV